MNITTTNGTSIVATRDGDLITIISGDQELDLTAADLQELIAAGHLNQVLADAEADPLRADEKEQISALTQAYETGSPHLRAALTAVTS
ncbi:hypothetical protein [Rhodococcus sp. NPDC004095]